MDKKKIYPTAGARIGGVGDTFDDNARQFNEFDRLNDINRTEK